MSKKHLVLLIPIWISINLFGQNHVGNYLISDGKLNVEYSGVNAMSSAQFDNMAGSFGYQGIGTLFGGDMHLRGYWGVVIDKNGGNVGESAAYNNGVLPASGSFAIRTRTSPTAFRTDFIIRHNGNVGIGMTSPEERLVVDGNIKFNQGSGKIYWDWPQRSIEQYSPDGQSRQIRFSNSMSSIGGNPQGGFNFTDNAGVSVLRINNYKVGIGTNNPDAPLTVAGLIHSREVKVSINAGADFVFKPNYTLSALGTLEKYIKTHHHLPTIASASEMQKNGIELGEMNIKLLQKIEELTLYAIRQEKRIQQLERKYNHMIKQLKSNHLNAKYEP